MDTRKSWAEMERDYPDEWLLISEIEWDELGNLKFGTVERHSKDKEEVYRQPPLDKPTAFRPRDPNGQHPNGRTTNGCQHVMQPFKCHPDFPICGLWMYGLNN